MDRPALFSALLFGVLTAQSASATDLALCGESKGYSFFPSAGLAEGKPSQWTDDGISGGRFTLKQLSNGKLDLLFIPATGAIKSSIQEGAEVVTLHHSKSSITVGVFYPEEIVEMYTFLETSEGPQVMWTTNKFNALIIKASVFNAKCSYLSIPRR